MSNVVSNNPDRGWSWVILAACTLSCALTGFAYGSFNVLYVELVEHFDSERGTTGWIGSLFGFTGNILGFLIGALDEKFGSKTLALVGSVLTCVGMLLSSLLISIPYMYITYGIIGGIGYTLVVLPTLVILPKYFNRRRPLAIGLATSGFSVGALASAPVVNLFLQEYGLSGSYILLAGIWLNNAISASLFRSLTSHNKSCKLHVKHLATITDNNDRCRLKNTPNDTNSTCDNTREEHTFTELQNEKHSSLENQKDPESSTLLGSNLQIESNGLEINVFKNKTNECEPKEVCAASKCNDQISAKSNFCSNLLDFRILRDIQFDLFLFSIFAINLGFAAFYMHYLSRILYLGIDRNRAILLQTTMGFCLGVGRCSISLVVNMKCVRRELLFGVLIIIMSVVEISFSVARQFTPLMIYGILHGFVGGAIMSLQSVILVDIGGTGRISKITGFFTMTAALGILLAIPLAGFIFDVSQSYDLPFYVAGSVTCLGGLVSLALAIHRMHKANKTLQTHVDSTD